MKDLEKIIEGKFNGSNVFWKIIMKHLTPETMAFIKQDYKRTVEEAIKAQRKELVGEIESVEKMTFPRGERPWCIECARRIRKHLLAHLKEREK